MDKQHDFLPGKKSIKRGIVKLVFWVIARGFMAGAKLDSKIRNEVENWEEGLTLILKVNPSGPRIAIKKDNGKLTIPKSYDEASENNIIIYFKNIEAALLVLIGQISSAQAFCEHRLLLKGDIALGMSIVRCMDIIENYLFPAFITNKILMKRPIKEVSSVRIYFSAFLGI